MPSVKNIVVQKFGGTSMADSISRNHVLKRIKEAKEAGKYPVVVVSAMGRKGSPYATDTLLSLVENAPGKVEPRAKDLLVSCGEIISAAVLSHELRHIGLQAAPLTGFQAGIVTNEKYGQAQITSVITENITNLIGSGDIPVVAGFQGMSPGGEITTLGRGGSDTTAGALAAALSADYLEIFTDVSGVMTADPKKVEDVKVIPDLNYQEVWELSAQGATIIHPVAAQLVHKEKIPLHIRSTFSCAEGTWIRTDFDKHPKLVTGVTSKGRIVLFKIIPRIQMENATALGAFKVLGQEGISVDFISVRPSSIAFIVAKEETEKARQVLEKHGYKYQISNDYCKVTIVGSGMTGVPGVMAKLVEALTGEAIPIYLATDSLMSISCLIKERDEIRALESLHNIFGLKEMEI